jgi:hypothetical protein
MRIMELSGALPAGTRCAGMCGGRMPDPRPLLPASSCLIARSTSWVYKDKLQAFGSSPALTLRTCRYTSCLRATVLTIA